MIFYIRILFLLLYIQPYKELVVQIAKVESQIYDKRLQYSDVVNVYNTRLSTFPGNFIGKILRFQKQPYYSWENEAEWVIEKERLGTGGAIKFASQGLKDEFLAFNVDDFPALDFNDFVSFHKNHNIENTIAIYRINDARDFGLVKHSGILIQEFLEKPKKKQSGYINTGFYILSPRIFKEFRQKSFSIEKDVFPVLAKKQRLACYQKIKHWFTTGTEERSIYSHVNLIQGALGDINNDGKTG